MKLNDLLERVRSLKQCESILSISAIGSRPAYIDAGKDMDFIVIVDHNDYQNALDKIQEFLVKLCADNDELTYSFFHGPIKYEHKGLVHMLVYLDQDSKEGFERPAFNQERESPVAGFLSNCETIIGKPLKSFYGPISIQESHDKSWINETKERYATKGFFHRCWVKVDGKWILDRRHEELSQWQLHSILKWLDRYQDSTA